tara:strand:+ start:162 stop:815 length:654 start_codon:yes stop_codon:yes gene_type:complete
MKKSIILYLNKDEIFTFPIAYYLIRKLSSKYDIFIKLANTSLKKKIKIILIILLDGCIKNLYNFYYKRQSINKLLLFKNVKILKNSENYKYEFGLSINYPKKILNNKLDVYNFHFGNFRDQRGTFIFFYKYIYKWTHIDLSFHKITNKLDSGKIINKKTINVKKMNSINMIAIPLKNMDFYLKSISKIGKKIKKIKTKIGPMNKEPSFLKIFNTKFD